MEDRGYITPCLIWDGEKDKEGYGRIKRDGRYIQVHWGLAGDPPEGMEKDHLCHQRDCVRPSHLEDKTKSQNTRNRRGAGNVSRRLTDEERADIVNHLRSGINPMVLVTNTGVSRRTIYRIKREVENG
jgi:hypothetical protein